MKRTRKTFLILLAVIGIGTYSMAQDVITLKNGDEIKAIVSDIGTDEVKYKKWDNKTGPTYTMKKNEVFMIKYENGSKDVFSEVEKQDNSTSESKSIGTKDNSISESINNDIETVYLPENVQNRKDVYVRAGKPYYGTQVKITHTDNKYIYFIKYKRNEKEKHRKINQRKIAFTLSFNEDAKQLTYPLRMDVRDFSSLPVYFDANKWVVFGTHSMSNLSQLKEKHQDIYDDFVKGQKQQRTGQILSSVGAFYIFPLTIVGAILSNNGYNKVCSSFENYYNTCFDLGVCAKYGIKVTYYRK